MATVELAARGAGQPEADRGRSALGGPPATAREKRTGVRGPGIGWAAVDVDDTPSNSEREQTDESLRLERERADRAIDEELASIDGAADEVIARARQRADEVLAAARAKMDESPALAFGARPAGSVDRARMVEDRDLREERADADEKVHDEREEHVAMLRVEREETDKDLSRERARADAALATRDDFLAVVSHDLRGLLNTIVLQATLIGREVLEEDHVEPVGKLANRIQLASGRMNRRPPGA